jgi:membrane protease YdiL (CAAX protease family)
VGVVNDAELEAPGERPSRLSLALWTAFVLVFAALSYGGRAAEGKPSRDVLYKWSTVGGNLVQYAVIALVVYGIAGFGRRRSVLALRRPRSWPRALGIGVGIVVGIAVLNGLLNPLLHPGREQGLTPTHWEPNHAAAYIANGAVIAIVAPVVEELTFRGLGFSLLRPFGEWPAILLVGILFAAAHGLVEAFPLLAAFGAALAYLRSRVDSVYPGMLVHSVFNTVSLVLAVA